MKLGMMEKAFDTMVEKLGTMDKTIDTVVLKLGTMDKTMTQILADVHATPPTLPDPKFAYKDAFISVCLATCAVAAIKIMFVNSK